MSIRTAPMNQIMNLMNNDKNGSDLTYKQLKIECIIRGMPFLEILHGDFFRLSNWLLTNVMKPKDESLLDDFDDLIERELRERGKNDFIHPSLRLGYVKRDEEDIPVEKTPKEKKEKKAPRKKDSNGLFSGTKKSYTYECQRRGKTLDQTIVKVMRKFPDAKEKSIKIWYNKAKKENK